MGDERGGAGLDGFEVPAAGPLSAVTLPWRRLGLLAAVALLAGLVAFPLVELFTAALGQGWSPVRAALAGGGVLGATRNTLGVAIAVTGLALTVGTLAALVTERSGAPGRRWLRLGMLAPLVVPPFVAALSWARAYGPSGLSEDLLGVAVPGTFGAAGVIVVLAVQAVPLAYVAVSAGLATFSEPDLERAARASGASAAVALRTVTLPLLRPSLAAGAALVFVTAVNAFGVPAVLGTPAGFRTVTTRIYADLALAADPAAFARVLVLAAGLVVVTLTVVGVADASGALTTGATRSGVFAGGATTGRGGRVAGAVLWGYIVLTTGIPLLALVGVALTRAVGLPPIPANWTLAHFGEALDATARDAVGHSLALAGGAATLAVVLGGLLVALRRARGGRLLGTGAILTFALPGSALAVAVLLAYSTWLRDTLWLILVAYVAKFWALAHRPVAGAAAGLPADAVRAARVSGASPATAARTVVLPLLWPAAGAAWLVVFLFGLHELTMSSLLYGPGSETLAVVVLNAQQLGDAPVTAALAVLLTAGVLVVAAPLVLLRPAPRR